jgi:hypothetical protein
MNTLLPIVVGFVLTSVLGGLLGTYLQRRTWDHQNEARLREEELRRASEICHRVSGLLDKRRYRMLRLFHALRGHVQGTVSTDVMEDKFRDYDQVLYEWNDSLNGNLAMVGTYFGEHARTWLEQAYEVYREVGGELEAAYREVAQGAKPAALDTLRRRFSELGNTAYRLSLFMMIQLREGMVGRRAAHPVALPGSLAEPRRLRP